MKRFGIIVTSAITSVITALVVVWFSEALVEIVPSPQRLLLRVQNALSATPSRSETRFRVVLCWFENDWSGKDTRNVEDAFSGVEGIDLVVSDEDIAASGAADEWRPAMQEGARAVLTKWNADLAVVGVVKQPGKVLNLWFVPRRGGGSLERGDQPYVLENATLGIDFHDHLQAHLAVVALTAVAPLADTAVRQRTLRNDLRTATDKLARLTRDNSGRRPEIQAAMKAGLATALVALGRTETGTDFFERAVAEYRAALRVFTRQRHPQQWGQAMNDLGVALVALAEWQTGTERLKEAATAYRAALRQRTRERAPLEWAQTQNNLGVALATIGERESDTELLKEAIAAYRKALEERSRAGHLLDVAMTQNNLANAMVRLYREQGDAELLDEGIVLYRAALNERSRRRVPLQWAQTQSNLGGALVRRGKRDSSAADLDDAIDIFGAVLEEHPRGHLPIHWARAQIGLGASLRALAKLKNSPKLLGSAIEAYRSALQVLSPQETPLAWATAQNNLGNALLDLAAHESSSKHLKEAGEAYRAALDALNSGSGSARFREEVKQLLKHTEQLLKRDHTHQ